MATMQEKLLGICLDSNTPVYLSGLPGIGKTAQVGQEVRKRDGILYVFQVSQRDPVDLTGAMHPVEVSYKDGVATVTRYSTPEWVHNLNVEAEAGRFVVVFLDEATTAAPMALNATLTLVQEHKAGEYKLHDDIRFVIAGNPPGTNSGVYDLTAAFANRIMHIEWTADVASWAEFILEPGNIQPTGNDDRHRDAGERGHQQVTGADHGDQLDIPGRRCFAGPMTAQGVPEPGRPGWCSRRGASRGGGG